jgi:glycerophosphoryl diester phosphodiesterase
MKKIVLTTVLVLISAIGAMAQIAQSKTVAHRGAWKADKLPQNSAASFAKAVELGCAGSEFDVYLTADSVLVLNHDAHFQSLSVEKSTLAQLQTKKLSNGENITQFDEIMELLTKQNRTLAFVEIKPSAVNQAHGFAAVDKILETVAKYKAEKMVIYISFDYSYLQRIVEKNPKARTAYLGSNINIKQIVDDKQFGIDFNQNHYKKNTEIIETAQKNGVNINVWTVNKAEDMQYFLGKNVDYITTDEPEMLINLGK